MGTRRGLLAFAILAPICLVGVALYNTNESAAAAQSVETMPMPSGWTAFDANWTSSAPGEKYGGRFHRASDGSFRREIYNERNELRILDIVNISTKESYSYLARTQSWRSQPVQYPDSGYLPPNYKVRANKPGVRLLANGYEGLDAYERRDPDGAVSIIVPMLNFLAVQSTAHANEQEQYTNIRIRPQTADLFRLPAGVTSLEKIDKPRVVLSYTK